jgi:transcription termination factor Rho
MPESNLETPSKRATKSRSKAAPKTAKAVDAPEAPEAASKPAAKRVRKAAVSAPEPVNKSRVALEHATPEEGSSAPSKTVKRARKPKVQDEVAAAPKHAAPQDIAASSDAEAPKTRKPRKKAGASDDANSGSHEPVAPLSESHGGAPSAAVHQRFSDESTGGEPQRKPYPVYVPLHVAKQMEQEGKPAPLAVAPDAQQAAQIRAAAFENRHGTSASAPVISASDSTQKPGEGGSTGAYQDQGERPHANRPQNREGREGRDGRDRHDRHDRRRGRKDRGNRGDRNERSGDRNERGGDRADRHERHQGGRREDHEHGGDSSQPLPPPTPEELSPGEGIIEISGKGFGFLRDAKRNFVQSPADIFVSPEMVRRFNLRDGQLVQGDVRRGGRGQQMHEIRTVNGDPPEASRTQPPFDELTVINPNEPLKMETHAERYTTRVLDIVAPIGKGQRGLIVAPPRTGKTTFLQHIADAVVKNHPDVHLIMLLVDERPEEVTEIRYTVPRAEIMASSNDMDVRSHTRIAELAIERAKRLVEAGKDVFVLLDSITRLGRAFNNAMTNGGRTMSGGMDARALEIPRRLFAAARNTEEAGSLTIVATALVETGSRMDELIFQEFKGTGNMELVLDRKIAEQRVYPAVEIFQSGTRREELLVPADLLNRIHFLRRGLAGCRPLDAIERLLFFLKKFPTNEQMLREIKVL